MPPLVSTIDIALPPEDVFSYVTDPFRFAEWQADVVSVRSGGGEPPAVGSRFIQTRRFAGAERTLLSETTELRPPTKWVVRGVDGPIRAITEVTIEPLEGGTRSRVTFALDFEGHGLGKPLLPLVRRQAMRGAPRSYRKLKQRLETGQ